MEANNGYEYKIVKGRAWPLGSARALERAVRRASLDGWEVVNEFVVEGALTTPAVTLRRRMDGDRSPEVHLAAPDTVRARPALAPGARRPARG
jgi:hypothetical protein